MLIPSPLMILQMNRRYSKLDKKSLSTSKKLDGSVKGELILIGAITVGVFMILVITTMIMKGQL